MTTARTKPVTMPGPPPSTWPRTRKSPVITPRSNVVLTTFNIRLFYVVARYSRLIRSGLQRGNADDEAGDERRAIRQRFNIHIFVDRVCAVTDRAESV